MNTLILGESGHGKDELAKILNRLCGIPYESSSMAAADAIFDELNYILGGIYQTPLDAFNDRQTHKHLWKRLISEYNTPDKGRLVKEVLSRVPVYVGLRDAEEYAATQHLFGLQIFVIADRRVGYPPTSTLDIEYNPLTMTLVDNNRTKARLHVEAFKLAFDHRMGSFAQTPPSYNLW